MARTNLGESDQRPFLLKLVFAAAVPFMSSVAKGAQSTIHAATSPEVEGLSNRYFGPKGQEKVSERHHTPAGEQAVWAHCMKVVGPYLPAEPPTRRETR
ncbi:hypothetical protein ACIBI9_67205 [Nonomuraea sp. NPDC050451]|uniref:hypothetical protein n=1 Tax=Nonomuraea sp. NPDC050451 TaxID=3364364 RepID=UPI003798D606